MDLHLIPGAVASDAERDAIDGALARGRMARHLLLPALHAAQRRVGWISEGALNHICAQLEVPPAEAYGVASFYAMFALAPRAPRWCTSATTSPAERAAPRRCARHSKRRSARPAACRRRRGDVVRSPCLGLCEQAPVAMVQEAGLKPADYDLAPVTFDQIRSVMTTAPQPQPVRAPSAPQTLAPRAPGLRLLRRIGVVDPESLDDYRAHGGYAALRRALALGPERVLREVNDSKLVGRGGAAFPTGRKWEAVARSPVRPHYLVCNADESEPGTFKDRVLMEQDPFALIEAMTIAGIATGCELGFLYIRGEYPLATRRLASAIAQARTRGLLGDNVMGDGVRFDIELRRGAGAYICGEETALFNSIEGLRGEPRNKPPFPVQSGLFRKPTVVNNVETLVNVLDIISSGGPEFSRVGTGGSAGTKLFCVSGCVGASGAVRGAVRDHPA